LSDFKAAISDELISSWEWPLRQKTLFA